MNTTSQKGDGIVLPNLVYGLVNTEIIELMAVSKITLTRQIRHRDGGAMAIVYIITSLPLLSFHLQPAATSSLENRRARGGLVFPEKKKLLGSRS